MIKIKKRNGKLENFDKTKIQIALQKTNASTDNLPISSDMIDKIENKLLGLNKKIINTNEIDEIIENILLENGFLKTAKEYIIQSLKKSSTEPYENIYSENDWDISNNALEILRERYLQVDETPLRMLRRVSRYFGRNKTEKDRFYELFINKRGISASPSLFNSDTQIRMFSPCFCLDFERDSLDSIYDTLEMAAIISKSGGGTGFNFSSLREKGAPISSSNGKSSGILSWLKLFDFSSSLIQQGGKRKGANMGILNCMEGDAHPEVLDFISLKMKENISTFNLSVLVDDYFMNSIEDNDSISLISPSSKKIVNRVPAQKIFNMIALGAYSSGDPGILFYDRINKDNYYSPEGKDLRILNPCGEFLGLPAESCDLGSLNLSNYENDDQLKYDTSTMTILLNRIIDKNKMPYKELQKAMISTRKIGIGIMGIGDYFLKNNIVYGSQQSLDELKRLLNIIKKSTIETSCNLDYPEIIDGRCNANLLSIAPTGTISTLFGTTSGIEPPFGWIYERRILDGSVQLESNAVFKEKFSDLDPDTLTKIKKESSIRNIDIFSKKEKDIFRIAFEIPPIDHLNIQASAQEIVDLGISKTILMPEFATIEDIKEIYLKAWKIGCKGLTIYRNNTKENQPISWNLDLSCSTGKCDL